MKLTRLSLAYIGIAFFLLTGGTSAQSADQKLSLNEGTIENQFNYVIQKSDKFEDYKMVKSWWLYRLKTHVLDSMKVEKDKLIESTNFVAIKEQEIVTLKADLEATNEKLDLAISEKNSLQFLGMTMSKATYNSFVWILIGGLAAGLMLYFILYRRSNAITVATKKSLAELTEEYEDYRKRSLAREQKTVRKLYDEILKYKSKVTKV
jgi:hypothetical protein